jgi:hypothetical protein
MRQHTLVVDASYSAKPGEPFAVIPKPEAIGAVDDPNLTRRACSGCLAFRFTTSAMESIHREERPEPCPVLLPRRRAPGAGSGGAGATWQARKQGQRSSAVNYMLAAQ